MTQPNADKLKGMVMLTCMRCGCTPCIRAVGVCVPDDTRPAARVGEDVVEAFIHAAWKAQYLYQGATEEAAEFLTIKKRDDPSQHAQDIAAATAGFTAAEAMGYTLTPSERVLPELPKYWFLGELFETTEMTFKVILAVRGDDSKRAYGEGLTPRAAVLAAIGKIGTK